MVTTLRSKKIIDSPKKVSDPIFKSKNLAKGGPKSKRKVPIQDSPDRSSESETDLKKPKGSVKKNEGKETFTPSKNEKMESQYSLPGKGPTTTTSQKNLTPSPQKKESKFLTDFRKITSESPLSYIQSSPYFMQSSSPNIKAQSSPRVKDYSKVLHFSSPVISKQSQDKLREFFREQPKLFRTSEFSNAGARTKSNLEKPSLEHQYVHAKIKVFDAEGNILAPIHKVFDGPIYFGGRKYNRRYPGKLPWTHEEFIALRQGFVKYGHLSNCWKHIKKDEEFREILIRRTACDLKDKHRNEKLARERALYVFGEDVDMDVFI